jgi:methylamine dehydrogenase accessory protein MauD
MDTVVLAIRILLVLVFATAGVGKLLDLQGSRRAVRDFGVPDRFAGAFGLLLPIVELLAAVALVFRGTAQVGAAGALLLLLAFIGGIANALRYGVAPDCHCFGQIHSAPAGRGTLIRNGVLGALALFVLIAGPGPAVDTWVGDRSAAELVAVGLGVGASILALFYFQLLAEVRQLRNDVVQLRNRIAAAPPGLPVGRIAPNFELQTVDGDTVSLDQLREPGLPVLLMFTSPSCGSCVEIFPNLRRWQQTLQERVTIALISSGSAADNKSLVDDHGLERLLLQENMEVVEAYLIRGTPSAVLITPDGKIGSLPAESAFSIEPMIRLVLRGGDLSSVPEASVA